MQPSAGSDFDLMTVGKMGHVLEQAWQHMQD